MSNARPTGRIWPANTKECLPFSVPTTKLFIILTMGMKNLQKLFSSFSHVHRQLKNDQENNIENLPLEVQLLISGLDMTCFFVQ
ncbi:UNVERIFIED_CONTAM: hypothetical protein NCL1_15811 [Trichonephila clavipes]